MGEFRITYPSKKIKYSGLFNLTETHKFIMNWFANQGYDMVEELTGEQVLEGYKQIRYDYKPYKKFTDFARAAVYLNITFDKVTEVIIDFDGVKRKMHKGDISISVTGYLETDYENKWETSPFYYFLKIVFEKFVFGGHQSYYKSYVAKTCKMFLEEFKSLLNINRLRV